MGFLMVGPNLFLGKPYTSCNPIAYWQDGLLGIGFGLPVSQE
jgi:hypothetical protein